jgi:fatty-acyl-CoA synthase
MDNPAESPFPWPLVLALRARPGDPCFEYRGRPVTGGGMLDLIGRCAGGLTAAGLGAGSSLVLADGVTPGAFAVRMAAALLAASPACGRAWRPSTSRMCWRTESTRSSATAP